MHEFNCIYSSIQAAHFYIVAFYNKKIPINVIVLSVISKKKKLNGP